MLKIIVNSSNNLDIGESKKAEVMALIENRLGRFSERLTRIEAYIGDETGPKIGGMDKRCMLEARPEGMQTLNVTEHAATVDQAVNSAAHKLEKMIDATFQRRESIQSRASRDSKSDQEDGIAQE